jgi:hypothetical protein
MSPLSSRLRAQRMLPTRSCFAAELCYRLARARVREMLLARPANAYGNERATKPSNFGHRQAPPDGKTPVTAGQEPNVAWRHGV